ncbi:MAG TPA: DoxX family protein [Pyrinomonadaceae bacterium]|nr:DoxX family protein [Pyrinomonadaceae bacterium]
MFRELVATRPTWATLPLRLALGAVFVAHGAQKVFGLWGGPGWAKFTSFPAPFGFMRPAWLWMGAAALSELVGGTLVLLGLFTRLGAFLLACTMLTAIVGVHGGTFFMPTGFEFALALLGMALALLIEGGGRASFDERLQSGGRRPYKTK